MDPVKFNPFLSCLKGPHWKGLPIETKHSQWHALATEQGKSCKKSAESGSIGQDRVRYRGPHWRSLRIPQRTTHWMPILNRGLVTAIPLKDNTIKNIASAFCKAPTPYSPALKKPNSAELTGKEVGQEDGKNGPQPSLLLPSLKSQVTSDFGGKGYWRVWSFDNRLDWTFYSCKWNWSDFLKMTGKAMKSPYNIIQEVRIKFFTKMFVRKEWFQLILHYSDKRNPNQLTKSIRKWIPHASAQSFLHRVDWLEGSRKQQGSLQPWQVCLGSDHTSGKKARLVLLPGCSEAHEISVSFSPQLNPS